MRLLALLPLPLVVLIAWVTVIGTMRDPNHLRLPAQQQVQTKLPKLGVHTRLTDEVEQAKIQRTFEMVRQMGAAWDVEYVPWNYVQPNGPNDWEWSHTDMVVAHAQRQGLKLLIRIDSVPDWARPKLSGHSLLTPAHDADFVRFVSTFARRYKGQVAGYVIWNEPNVNYEWGYQPPDPAGYASLLKAVYPTLKAADPHALVLAAALAPNTDHSATALNDLDYLRQFYAAGAAPYFDGLAAHAYGWQHPPNEAPSPDTVNFRRVELERDIMVQNGDAAKQVYITESGWNDYARWVQAVTPTQRIDYTVQAVQLASSWNWLATICLWEFRLPTDPHNYNNAWTLVNFDFSPSPTYVALQRLSNPNPPKAWQPFVYQPARPNAFMVWLQQMATAVNDQLKSWQYQLTCKFQSCSVPPDISLLQVQRAGVLKVVVDASFPPLESVQPNGQLAGIDIRVAGAIASSLGVQPKLTNMSSDGLKDAVLSGQADAIVSSFQVVPEWKKELAYSLPYYLDSIPTTVGLNADGSPLISDEPVQYVVAVRAGRNKLLAAIDQAVVDMARSGQLKDLTGENPPPAAYCLQTPASPCASTF